MPLSEFMFRTWGHLHNPTAACCMQVATVHTVCCIYHFIHQWGGS